MKSILLTLKEIRHRPTNFLSSVLVVSWAVAVIVIFTLGGDAYQRETIRIVRDMGQNLKIIPAQTNMNQFWITGYSEDTMPEEYVYRFAKLKGYDYTHLTAKLQKQVEWNGKNVLLTGILPTVLPLDRRHQQPFTFYSDPTLIYSVEPGNVYVGHEIANSAGLEEGDIIELFGKKLAVEVVLSRVGQKEDIRIYGNLHDIQSCLGLEAKINEIEALECVCLIEISEGVDPWEKAKTQLAQILPEARVLRNVTMADLRIQQRAAVEGYMIFIIPVLLICAGTCVAVLAMNNITSRMSEIAIMNAMGFTPAKMLLLFLGKSFAIGLLGGALGFGLGYALLSVFGPQIFKVTSTAIRIDNQLLIYAVVFAPVFTVIWSFVSIIKGIVSDPYGNLVK